jgi:excisionase family DNA binding protein
MTKWMTSEEAAEYTGFSLSTLKKWRRQKRGPVCWRISRKAVRYRQAEVDQWIESHQKITCGDLPSAEAEMKKNSPELVSKKIKVLVDEGVPQKQAVATAINMGKKGRITKSGGYRRVKK